MKFDSAGNLVFILILYVDDFLYSGTTKECKTFATKISQRFKIKTKDEAAMYIGVQIQQTTDSVKLYQQKDIESLKALFDLSNKTFSTPIDPTYDQTQPSEALPSPQLYQRVIGCLNYLNCSCHPDIAFAVGLLAKKNVSLQLFVDFFYTWNLVLSYSRNC